jgi:hypothetical protein
MQNENQVVPKSLPPKPQQSNPIKDSEDWKPLREIEWEWPENWKLKKPKLKKDEKTI